METAQERQLQGRQAWPFHMMAATTTGCLLDAGTNYSYSSSTSCGLSGGAGDCFVLGWEPPTQLGCFGLLAADVHELFPLFADMVESSPLPVTSSALAVPPPAPLDAVAVPQNLDDLLLNFWDASCHDGDVGAQQLQVAFNSSCCLPLPHETSSSSATTTTTTNSFFPCDYDDDPLSSIFSTGPVLAENALLQAPAPPEPPSSSSSNCHANPRGSDGSGAQVQCTAATPSAARAPPLPPPRSSSLKRSTREAAESEQAESSENGGSKRRKASARVVCPFALLKPDGLDGGATLADINARILMRPSRPVRHPVGEFACAPRVSADKPGISGKAVSSFTRLHTPGRGTITIIRTRG
ncbi:hypothetical protein EJB05_43254 [Eragrostis curvula]|uniref:Protein XRI1 n=1 Tax=Eragrostis curvula TaxID=38414 RepID=A0A5J9TEM0_9POAL|nr:hypothetical protein EJB05_43254 [Eragrostis curvula]